jgi:hypothetical protein
MTAAVIARLTAVTQLSAHTSIMSRREGRGEQVGVRFAPRATDRARS